MGWLSKQFTVNSKTSTRYKTKVIITISLKLSDFYEEILNQSGELDVN